MNKANNNSKYVFKVIVLIIVVIINIIAIMGVVTTVGKTVNELRTNISSGKISKEKNNVNLNQINEDETDLEPADMENESELDMDFGALFKKALSDKNVLKSIILMIIALVLLAGAVVVLIKLG